ncbi:MAG: hypothetical protein AB1405_08890 [Bdellovibrionota bacterium]
MAQFIKGPLGELLVGLALKDPSKPPARETIPTGEESEADRQAALAADYVERVVRAQLWRDQQAGVESTFVPKA